MQISLDPTPIGTVQPELSGQVLPQPEHKQPVNNCDWPDGVGAYGTHATVCQCDSSFGTAAHLVVCSSGGSSMGVFPWSELAQRASVTWTKVQHDWPTF